MILLFKSAIFLLDAAWVVARIYMAVITTKTDHPIYEQLPVVVARVFRLSGVLFAVITSWFFLDTFLHRVLGLEELQFNLSVWYDTYPAFTSAWCLALLACAIAYCVRTPVQESMGWLILGNFAYQFDAYDIALNVLKRAVNLNPKLASAYSRIAFIEVVRGDFEKAIADADLALAIGPAQSLALVSRGIAYFRKQDIAQAVRDIAKSIRLDHAVRRLLPSYIVPGPLEAFVPTTTHESRSTKLVLTALYWETLRWSNDTDTIDRFAKAFNGSQEARDARERLSWILWRNGARESDDIQHLRTFAREFADTSAAKLADARADRISNQEARRGSRLVRSPARSKKYAIVVGSVIGVLVGIIIAHSILGSRPKSPEPSVASLRDPSPSPELTAPSPSVRSSAPGPSGSPVPGPSDQVPQSNSNNQKAAQPSSAVRIYMPRLDPEQPAKSSSPFPAPLPSLASSTSDLQSRAAQPSGAKPKSSPSPQFRSQAKRTQVPLQDLPELTTSKMSELQTYGQVVDYLGQPSRKYEGENGHMIVEYDQINPGSDKLAERFPGQTCSAQFDLYSLVIGDKRLPMSNSKQNCSWHAPK